MGCRCCRMIKSYIYDPSVGVDVRKSDSAGSSLYQPQHLSGGVPDPPTPHRNQKQGFHNLGYSKSNDSTLKLEADNNHVNYKLHAAPSPSPGEAGLYIIQPDAVGPRWVMQERIASQVPVYPNIRDYETQRSGERGRHEAGSGWDGSGITGKSVSTDEIDEGVGGTPEYPCDTGDEGSVLSVDIHTSTTSLSSADTKDEPPKTPDASTLESGISVAKSEDEVEVGDRARREADEVESVTESMVAEALAALEAATAGEECE
ncbi:uncharacterized protein LOC115408135 [Salarias fasciatus]|uniref:Uncharacterized LOC115408135 n=1 Tax=Salarias fasciatus TaxID=181472 RepID=A0A672J1L5_SALFA|nr:uncharacterized protein LOC115408135 [Salarias fasciatus]